MKLLGKQLLLDSLLRPIVQRIPYFVTPDMLTCIGGLLNIFVIWLYAYDTISLATTLWLSLVLYIFDIFDGAIARYRKESSRRGAVLDAGVDSVIAFCLLLVAYGLGMMNRIWLYLIACLYIVRVVTTWFGKDSTVGASRLFSILSLLMFVYYPYDYNIALWVIVITNLLALIAAFLWKPNMQVRKVYLLDRIMPPRK